MNFELYAEIRELLEQYNPIVDGKKWSDTLTIKKINLKVTIFLEQDFISISTLKDGCDVGHFNCYDLHRKKKRSNSQMLLDFKDFLAKAIKIGKLEVNKVKNFSVQRVKGLSRLEELQKGGYKIIVNNDISFRFSHVKIHEDNIALGLQSRIVKVFHGDVAKEVLAECAKFEDLKLMERY